MLNPADFLNALTVRGVRFFAGVPDSLLKPFCACITDFIPEDHHVIAANEGAAVSLGVGHHLATGDVPCIYLQNSGLGNLVNPLLSIAAPEVYAIPLLLVIGWRGEPGVRDEPQHIKQGRITLALLEAMEIAYTVLDPEMDDPDAERAIDQGIKQANRQQTAYAYVIRKNTFLPFSPLESGQVSMLVSRESVIQWLVEALDPSDVVVATTGMISRELFECRAVRKDGHHRDFLTVGGMGHTSQIALGVALGRPDRRVICVDGDGSVLMHMGSLAINGVSKAANFRHVLLNNGAHDSVGGQPTVGFQVDFPAIARASGYVTVLRAETPDEIRQSLQKILSGSGPSFLEIRVRKGCRNNLGRPTRTPIENKRALMEFLK